MSSLRKRKGFKNKHLKGSFAKKKCLKTIFKPVIGLRYPQDLVRLLHASNDIAIQRIHHRARYQGFKFSSVAVNLLYDTLRLASLKTSARSFSTSQAVIFLTSYAARGKKFTITNNSVHKSTNSCLLFATVYEGSMLLRIPASSITFSSPPPPCQPANTSG